MTNQLTKDRLVKICPSVFKGTVGKLSGTLHLHAGRPYSGTDTTAIQTHTTSNANQTERRIGTMERLQIIEREDEPTDCQSILTLVRKPNGKSRVCIDPKPLNKAFK